MRFALWTMVIEKAPSTKRGLAEQSEDWGSFKSVSPLIAFGDLSPSTEGGAFWADRVVRPYDRRGGERNHSMSWTTSSGGVSSRSGWATRSRNARSLFLL